MDTPIKLSPHRQSPGAPTVRAVPTSDLNATLGDLSDAISVVTVVDRSLAAQELAGAGDEEVILRHALSLLRTVYERLDRAIQH